MTSLQSVQSSIDDCCWKSPISQWSQIAAFWKIACFPRYFLCLRHDCTNSNKICLKLWKVLIRIVLLFLSCLCMLKDFFSPGLGLTLLVDLVGKRGRETICSVPAAKSRGPPPVNPGPSGLIPEPQIGGACATWWHTASATWWRHRGVLWREGTNLKRGGGSPEQTTPSKATRLNSTQKSKNKEKRYLKSSTEKLRSPLPLTLPIRKASGFRIPWCLIRMPDQCSNLGIILDDLFNHFFLFGLHIYGTELHL